jgi:hypothetical protein
MMSYLAFLDLVQESLREKNGRTSEDRKSKCHENFSLSRTAHPSAKCRSREKKEKLYNLAVEHQSAIYPQSLECLFLENATLDGTNGEAILHNVELMCARRQLLLNIERDIERGINVPPLPSPPPRRCMNLITMFLVAISMCVMIRSLRHQISLLIQVAQKKNMPRFLKRKIFKKK